MDGGPAPNLGLLEGGGQLQFIQHLFGFQLVRQFSLGIGRKDMGVGSPTLVGVRLVMLCIANSIRSSLIKVNVQGLTSKVNAGSCTAKNPWKLPRVKSLKYQGGELCCRPGITKR